MSRTVRIYNKDSSQLFEHPFKLDRRTYRCDCSWCLDRNMSKHRREKNKIEIKRELDNLSDPALIRFPHFPCINWKEYIYINDSEGCCMETTEVSMRRASLVK